MILTVRDMLYTEIRHPLIRYIAQWHSNTTFASSITYVSSARLQTSLVLGPPLVARAASDSSYRDPTFTPSAQWTRITGDINIGMKSCRSGRKSVVVNVISLLETSEFVSH